MPETKKPRGKLRSIAGGKGGGKGAGPTSGEGNPPSGDTPSSTVLDFTTAKAQRTLENRRRVERYFLDQVLDVFCEVSGATKPQAVRLSEVSESGCSFSLDRDEARNLPKDSGGEFLPIEAKIYFSGDSFIRVGFRIMSLTPEVGAQHTTRVGCQLDPAFSASQAFIQFVRFVEAFCLHCGTDVKRTGSF